MQVTFMDTSMRMGCRCFIGHTTQGELLQLLDKHGFRIIEIEQRQPIYGFEFQSERIYLIAEKI
jgi:hypothetical protein